MDCFTVTVGFFAIVFLIFIFSLMYSVHNSGEHTDDSFRWGVKDNNKHKSNKKKGEH